jgi:peptidoglycan hydrolase-like protein with peptidoglycan-binding domain
MKYFLFIRNCLVFGCVLGILGCDFIYGFLDKEGAQEKTLIGEVSLYDSNAVVKEVQTLLNLYGYSVGQPDGVLGGRTRKSIERFQKDRALKITRFIDEATWESLQVFSKNGLVAQKQLNLSLIQAILQKSGFDPGTADGKMGNKTLQAIIAFQKKHQLKADGKVGYKTLEKLSEYLPSQKE